MSKTEQGTATIATAKTATAIKAKVNVKASKAATSVKSDVKEEAKKKNRSSLLDHLKVESSNIIAKPKGGGNTGDHLFREGILPKDNKNSARKKIRKNLDLFAANFKAHSEKKDAKSLKGLKADFDAYYAKVYKTNDYTLASLLGGNTKGPRKESIEGLLKTIKAIK
jgi:hypothetical protein